MANLANAWGTPGYKLGDCWDIYLFQGTICCTMTLIPVYNNIELTIMIFVIFTFNGYWLTVNIATVYLAIGKKKKMIKSYEDPSPLMAFY